MIAARGGGASRRIGRRYSARAATIAPDCPGIAGLLSGGAAAIGRGGAGRCGDVKIFQIEAVLDNDVFSPSLRVPRRSASGSGTLKDQATWLGVRRAWPPPRSGCGTAVP